MFRHDRQTGETIRVSIASVGTEGNGPSNVGDISADGRYIVFDSNATNLVAGDTNGHGDVFVRDTQAGTTTRVSIANDESEANNHSTYPSISDDGRYIAFLSFASNLVTGDTNGTYDIFLRDTQAGTTTRINTATDGTEANSYSTFFALSGNGAYISFSSTATNLIAGDSNGRIDLFIRSVP